MPIQLTERDIDLLAALVATEADARVARTSPEQYELQVRGIVDTVLNRVESDQFPNTVAGVANQRSQFSAINGPRDRDYTVYGRIENTPAAPAAVRDMVANWVTERQAGAPSSVGGGLHYANPALSDRSNLGWINELDGPLYGTAGMAHVHGTARGFRPAEADMYVPPSDRMLEMAGLSSFGPPVSSIGSMPAVADLAVYRAPALDATGAMPNFAALSDFIGRNPDGSFIANGGSLTTGMLNDWLANQSLGSPSPRDDVGAMPSLAELQAMLGPPDGGYRTAEGLNVNPVSTVAINPATGMPYPVAPTFDGVGSMPSFPSVAATFGSRADPAGSMPSSLDFANFTPGPATPVGSMPSFGSVANYGPSPSTSVGSMPSRSELAAYTSLGSMPSFSDLQGWAGSSTEAQSGAVRTGGTIYARPDGSESYLAPAGTTQGPAGKPSNDYLPTSAPTTRTVTQTVPNPAYAQWMTNGAAMLKEQEKQQAMEKAREETLNSSYFKTMAGAQKAVTQQKPLPTPKPLTPPPKTITVTKTVPVAPKALPKTAPKAAPKVVPKTRPKQTVPQQFIASMAPSRPSLPPAPAGAVGTAAGYYYGKGKDGNYVNLGRVNPNLTPAQTYANASNYDPIPNGREWTVGVRGVGPSSAPDYGSGRYDLG